MGGIEGTVDLRNGESRERRTEKECSDMRNVWDQWESKSPPAAVAERKRLNQHSSGVGGGRNGGCGGGLGKQRRVEREVEADERRDSRVRVWAGRRRRSFWERKEWASDVAAVTRLPRWC